MMMAMRRWRWRGDSGFTLVETLAALTLFTLITLGVVPLMASSLRGATLARSQNVGKNYATEAMERIRGLPYFISFTSVNQKVDVLDLYFPSASGSSGGVFTTRCPGSTPNPACPAGVPEGYTMTFRARFVRPITTTTPQTYTTVTPPTGYAWNSTAGTDLPPSKLLEVTVIAGWPIAGETRTFELTTLIGDRRFGGVRMAGFGRVDYGLEVVTQYVSPTNRTSTLVGIVGTGESRLESRLVATADQVARAAEFRLTQGALTGGVDTVDIAEMDGAVSSAHAPPDSSPTGDSEVAQVMLHPDLDPVVEIAGIDENFTGDLEVGVAGELPQANGAFSFLSGAGVYDVWVNNQAELSGAFRFAPSVPMVSLVSDGANAVSGRSFGESAPTTSGREVQTGAEVEVHDLHVLPTTFINAADPAAPHAVVVIDDFRASVDCRATADTTASADAEWSATLSFWRDPVNDGLLGGPTVPASAQPAYVSLALSGVGSGDPLQSVRADNPLVFDGPTADTDVYLFEDPALRRSGYLRRWSSLVGVGGQALEEGRLTSASVDGAMRITTMPTNRRNPQTAINLALGKLSCQAEDRR